MNLQLTDRLTHTPTFSSTDETAGLLSVRGLQAEGLNNGLLLSRKSDWMSRTVWKTWNATEFRLYFYITFNVNIFIMLIQEYITLICKSHQILQVLLYRWYTRHPSVVTETHIIRSTLTWQTVIRTKVFSTPQVSGQVIYNFAARWSGLGPVLRSSFIRCVGCVPVLLVGCNNYGNCGEELGLYHECTDILGGDEPVNDLEFLVRTQWGQFVLQSSDVLEERIAGICQWMAQWIDWVANLPI